MESFYNEGKEVARIEFYFQCRLWNQGTNTRMVSNCVELELYYNFIHLLKEGLSFFRTEVL